MKKFLFSALACVAFAGSVFASNEVVGESLSVVNEYAMITNDVSDDNSGIVYKYTCNVSIYYTDFWGNEHVYTETKYFYFVTPLQGGGMWHSHADEVAQKFRTLSKD